MGEAIPPFFNLKPTTMKVFNAQSSYPGVSDGYIVYEGNVSTIGNGAYSDATYYEFRVNTEIICNLVAVINCVISSSLTRIPDNSNTPNAILRSFTLPYKIEKRANQLTTVVFRVPAQCVATYRISGDKNITQYLGTDSEVVESEQGFDEGFGEFGHVHDGIDSAKILASLLKPAAGNANKFLKVSADGNSIIYAGTNSPPATFNLLTPANQAQLDILLASTNFTWEESAGATGYVFKLFEYGEPDPIVDEVIASSTETYTVLHNLLNAGAYYYWYVIATNATDSTSSAVRYFSTNDPTNDQG